MAGAILSEVNTLLSILLSNWTTYKCLGFQETGLESICVKRERNKSCQSPDCRQGRANRKRHRCLNSFSLSVWSVNPTCVKMFILPMLVKSPKSNAWCAANQKWQNGLCPIQIGKSGAGSAAMWISPKKKYNSASALGCGQRDIWLRGVRWKPVKRTPRRKKISRGHMVSQLIFRKILSYCKWSELRA